MAAGRRGFGEVTTIVGNTAVGRHMRAAGIDRLDPIERQIDWCRILVDIKLATNRHLARTLEAVDVVLAADVALQRPIGW